MIDEKALFAYIDGELPEDARCRIEAMIEADPALQETVAQHRALASRLQNAFSTISDAPIPSGLLAPLSSGQVVSSLAAERSRRERRRTTWNGSHWGALAATLMIGLIGGAIFTSSSRGLVAEQGRQLVASGQLERALNTQLASTQGANLPIRIGLTFKNHSGAICRSFTAETTEGVACRQGMAWQLQGLLAREGSRTGDYRMAASSVTAELVDKTIDGDAFDPAQERAAQLADWAEPRAR